MILHTRQHPILTARKDQLHLNWLALHGGQPYIHARLWRAPNESEASWTGGQTTATGRRNRAAIVNDASRIAAKINQYLFSRPTDRTGIDPAFADDCTGTGQTIAQFWHHASETLTACQWLWIQADRGAPPIDPATGLPRPRTLAQRHATGDRPRLTLWHPWEVADWCFDAAGSLLWLITHHQHHHNTDPGLPPATHTIRTLWRRGHAGAGATWEQYRDGSPAPTGRGQITPPEIPFTLIGTPAPHPWWFDDAEALQAQLLNLDSLHYENLQRAVFPQLIISESTFTNLEARLTEHTGAHNGQRLIQLVKEITRGLDAPIIETADDKGITRYIQPSATDLKALPEEMTRKRALLFHTVGLSLFNRETRQIQTAQSKQFDHLDTESTLRHRALTLQEAERKTIAHCRALDTAFPPYDPAWPQEFSIEDPSADITALTQAAAIPNLTPTMRKAILKAVTRTIGAIQRLTDAERQTIAAEIQATQ